MPFPFFIFSGIPKRIKILYRSVSGLIAKRGLISWDGTPVITADGVTPGNGPRFADVITWTDGATLYVKMKMLKSSTGITGDEQVFGPLYLRGGFLVAKDTGGQEAYYIMSWFVGDVVTAIITTLGSEMFISGVKNG